MEAKAVAKFIRIGPRKVRSVADLVRGKSVAEARAILRAVPQRGGRAIGKCLDSAVANAEHNYEMDPESLYVKRIFVDEGPTLKRWQPRAMGRANIRRRRTSHITVVVGQKEE